MPDRQVNITKFIPRIREGRTVKSRAPRVGLRSGRNGKRYSLAERLAARTVKGPSCWECQGHQLPNGYLQLKTRGADGRLESISAHRLAYQLAHGPIPSGLSVCHRCDNPRCVNPAHLFLGTQAENVLDCIQKGRRNAFGRQKLTPDTVRQIRQLGDSGLTQRAIGARFNVARNTVSAILSRKAWGWLPDHPALDRAFERVPSVQLPIVWDVA